MPTGIDIKFEARLNTHTRNIQRHVHSYSYSSFDILINGEVQTKVQKTSKDTGIVHAICVQKPRRSLKMYSIMIRLGQIYLLLNLP